MWQSRNCFYKFFLAAGQGRERLSHCIQEPRGHSPGYFNSPQNCDYSLSPLSSLPLYSPLVFLRDLPERGRETPDVERLVTIIAQYLTPGLVLPSTHTARTKLALATRIVPTVLAVRLLLTSHSLFIWEMKFQGMNAESMEEWEHGSIEE